MSHACRALARIQFGGWGGGVCTVTGARLCLFCCAWGSLGDTGNAGCCCCALLTALLPPPAALCAPRRSYALRTTGHSLGGGVAGMLALQLHRDDDIVKAAYRTLPVPNKKDKGNYM